MTHVTPIEVTEAIAQKAAEMFEHGSCICGKTHHIFPETPYDEAAMDCPTFGLVWEWRLGEMLQYEDEHPGSAQRHVEQINAHEAKAPKRNRKIHEQVMA